MNKMTQLIQDYDYLTPKMAEKSGVSKFKFYKYVHENGLEQVGHGIYISSEENHLAGQRESSRRKGEPPCRMDHPSDNPD